MNNEIKEILTISGRYITNDEKGLILDYITNLEDTLIDKQECIDAYNEIINNRDKKITNLQEENKYLNNELNNMTDYAKDLQQENERLKEQLKKDNHILGCNFASKDKYKQRYEDYKSRCEKASEELQLGIDSYNNGGSRTGLFECIRISRDILQNGSDDNE